MYRGNSGPAGGLEQLFAYYHLTGMPPPPEDAGPEELAAHFNENTPLILVPVTLDGAWHRGLSCPMVVWDREGLCHVVLPDRLGRACCYNEGNGRRVYITGKNRKGFRREGCAVQRNLPGEAPGLSGALARLRAGMGLFETGIFLLWSVLGGGLLLALGEQLHMMVNNAALGLETADTAGYGMMLAVLLLAGLGLLRVGEAMVRRISRRAALGLLPALGERVWLAAGTDLPAQRAGGLARLREDGETLVRWALAALWGAGAGAVPAARLAAAFPGLAGTAGGTGAVLLAAAAVTVWLCAGRPVKTRAGEEYRWLENQTGDKRFGVERAFPFGVENTAGGRAGLVWLALPLLTAPVLFLAEGEGLPLAGLVRAVTLYLPLAVFPLAVLAGAGRAGRALAALRALLGQGDRQSGHDRTLPKGGSALELKSVTFTYPGRREPVLRDVDLRVFPGEVLGIAGGTGAGKTTLARLMAGLLTPDAGQVYYDGIELGRYERESVLRRIALENGEDIRLLERAPEEPDGRTTVVFSAREEDLSRCERVFDLSGGRLVLRERAERARVN